MPTVFRLLIPCESLVSSISKIDNYRGALTDENTAKRIAERRNIQNLARL